MLEKLKNMEPLPYGERVRIDRRLRYTVLAAALCVAAFLVFLLVTRRQVGKWYLVVVFLFLACNWILADVMPIFCTRALAGKSDAQVSAYLKVVGLGLVANAGLGWFLVAMQRGSIYGAVVYFIAVTAARKQREIWAGPAPEEGTGGTDGSF